MTAATIRLTGMSARSLTWRTAVTSLQSIDQPLPDYSGPVLPEQKRGHAAFPTQGTLLPLGRGFPGISELAGLLRCRS